ncbi:hypothetical protein MPS_3725 [Mycobacterium pseudoshottsii JCM 15466]|nr:hypothetical protein MPS_3725 [Mycobacterium pseudoshottsii JCM 15466]
MGVLITASSSCAAVCNGEALAASAAAYALPDPVKAWMNWE